MTKTNKVTNGYDMIVIGASTGGPLAVKTVLRELPADFPVGIAYVQHMQASFYEQYAQWLNNQLSLSVRLAVNNDYPSPGEVVLAPARFHLVFEDCRLVLDDSPPIKNLRPSVDKLFVSAADCFGERLIGIILTGMGSDGAVGCCEILAHNGYTIAQDEETSIVYGMPKVALARNGVTVVLPLEEIGHHLKDLIGISR
ncbi:MAG: chemotaxis protein CheB [Spirochaetes bacterium]|nr:chemotaxis protein CheB [Spirochaetota bacterium]